MIRWAKYAAIVLAWFLSTGGQWGLLQSFAWGRMAAEYVHSMSWKSALTETFAGEACEICKLVESARESDSDIPALPGDKQWDARPAPMALLEGIVIQAPRVSELVFPEVASNGFNSWFAPPEVPPPCV